MPHGGRSHLALGAGGFPCAVALRVPSSLWACVPEVGVQEGVFVACVGSLFQADWRLWGSRWLARALGVSGHSCCFPRILPAAWCPPCPLAPDVMIH